MCLVQAAILVAALASCREESVVLAPYPASEVIKGLTWHVSSYLSGAIGSDLFPTTWTRSDLVVTAWGDGKGFSAKNKKSYGVSIFDGMPPQIIPHDVYYGPDGPGHGKIIDIIAVDGILYGTVNQQDGNWPDVAYRFTSSADNGKSWSFFSWAWPKGIGSFEPRRFLHAGKDYTAAADGFLYVYGRKVGEPTRFYLARVHKRKIREGDAYEYLTAIGPDGKPSWGMKVKDAKAVFSDRNMHEFGLNSFCVTYNQKIDRYLAVTSHGDAGKVGVFDAPHPWGPWTTVEYYENWLGMSDGIFLSMSFPGKWMSQDGSTMWAVFSVHGPPVPATYHDRFNLMQVTVNLYAR